MANMNFKDALDKSLRVTKKYIDDAISKAAIDGEVDTSNFAPIDSPEFTTAISLHRKADSVVGNFSSALGSDVTASADYSHAEGVATVASGMASHAEGASSKAIGTGAHAEGGASEATGAYSHAEGYYTKAGDYSHAEGYQAEATGTYSHAEGYQTKATVGYSHAEGANTEASNQYAHAEGRATKATGMSSHAEGYQTIAKGENQHAQGKFNIEDTENKYAHIVGNGESNNNRSNAHTLDWDGNAWFAGEVQANNIPYIISDTVLGRIPASEIQTAINNTEGGGGTLGKYLYFEIDNPDLEVGEIIFIEYGGYTFSTPCPPNGQQTSMYYVDIVVSDNSDTPFVVPEGQMMLFIKRGVNKNGEVDETKCRVAGNLDQFNVTDMVIRHKIIKNMDNMLLGADVSIINSLSMGRANNTSIGFNSVALGEHAEASRAYSIALGNDVHAQGAASVSLGQQNISSGSCSFTSGYGNIASGNYSNAEGRFNKASAAYTHAEGYKNEAAGTYGHAEGTWTVVKGSAGHAEGSGSQANGHYSHAEGLDTLASSQCQHVQGKYNLEDTAQTYAHIVGNGQSKDVRSNAHTLDWNGNAWFQGKVSIDGVPENDNDLTTKAYVDNAINTSSIIRPYEVFRVEETIFGKTGYIDVETMEPSVKYGLAEAYLDCNSIAFVVPTATTPYAIVCIAASFQVSDLMVTEKWEGDPDKGEEGLYIIIKGLNVDYKINIRHRESKDGVTVETIRNIRYLDINNTKEFIPTGDYSPATKKYVDDAIAENGFSGDYNDLENRPCYDERVIETFNSAEDFNGDITGKVVIEEVSPASTEEITAKGSFIPRYVKMGDVAPVFNNLASNIENGNVKATCTVRYEHVDLTEVSTSELYMLDEDCVTLVDSTWSDRVYFVYNEITSYTGTVLSPGIWYTYLDNGEGTVIYPISYSIELLDGDFKKLDYKFVDYLPGENVEGKTFSVSIMQTGADGYPEQVDNVQRTAAKGAEIFNDYKTNVATGENAHAEGTETMAVGEGTHAEGGGTKALEYYAHAEGNRTSALGNGAHSEGIRSVAGGGASHAEGYEAKAYGERSHAEGASTETARTTWYGHAEGYYSVSKGQYASHAEGYYTIAASNYQHVQGKYNIEDAAEKYAHIVGNGTSTSNRKNAHTLDWNGNAWFQGKVSIDGTPENDNDLTTKKYVDDAINNNQGAKDCIILKDRATGLNYELFIENGELKTSGPIEE